MLARVSPQFAGGEDRRRQVRLEVALPTGATFSRASTKSRAVESGGAPVVHAINVPVFEWVAARGRRCLSIDRPGADPVAGDFCTVPLLGNGSAGGGMVGVDVAPQFDASARVGQGDDDVALVYGALELRWMGTAAGGLGAEAGFRLVSGASALKTLMPRHSTGDRLRIRFHWGAVAPHLQVDGWAKICAADVTAFPAPGVASLGSRPAVGLQCPVWFLDCYSAVGRQTPSRLFAVAGDSISAETDEAAAAENVTWPRTFGNRLFASEGGYVLAEGRGGWRFGNWIGDLTVSTSNATDVVIALGTNDIIAAAPLAQMQDDATALAATYAGRRVYETTITPGGFAGADEAKRLAFNAWLRAGGIPALAGVIDSCDSVADPGDNSVILPAYARDQYHPNDAGQVVLGDRIADLLGLPA